MSGDACSMQAIAASLSKRADRNLEMFRLIAAKTNGLRHARNGVQPRPTMSVEIFGPKLLAQEVRPRSR